MLKFTVKENLIIFFLSVNKFLSLLLFSIREIILRINAVLKNTVYMLYKACIFNMVVIFFNFLIKDIEMYYLAKESNYNIFQ